DAVLGGAGVIGDLVELHRSNPLGLVDDANEVTDLGDHAADRRSILQRRTATDAVEAEPDQRRALVFRPPVRAAGLLDRHGPLAGCLLGHDYASATSVASTSRRRDCSVETLTPRRAATARGLSSLVSALKVARTMLYGFDEPNDLATTSCTPS